MERSVSKKEKERSLSQIRLSRANTKGDKLGRSSIISQKIRLDLTVEERIKDDIEKNVTPIMKSEIKSAVNEKYAFLEKEIERNMDGFALRFQDTLSQQDDFKVSLIKIEEEPL